MYIVTWFGVGKERAETAKELADIITRYIMIEGLEACLNWLGVVYQESLTQSIVKPAIEKMIKEREELK